MIVKIESPIATFAKWKAMVHSNSEKIKKYGMTFLYAGTEKDNDSKITTIIRFVAQCICNKSLCVTFNPFFIQNIIHSISQAFMN